MDIPDSMVHNPGVKLLWRQWVTGDEMVIPSLHQSREVVLKEASTNKHNHALGAKTNKFQLSHCMQCWGKQMLIQYIIASFLYIIDLI